MSSPSSPDAPTATLWPSRAADDEVETVQVTVYIVSGRHGGLTVPESFCRECHLFVRAADRAADQVDVPVRVDVVSWWTRFPWALRHGGYHPPVMVVGGSASPRATTCRRPSWWPRRSTPPPVADR